jgi:hypothetical protein
LVFIIYRSSQSLTELFSGLKESGHKVLVLQIGDTEESEPVSGIVWHRIRQPGDFTRVGIEEIV